MANDISERKLALIQWLLGLTDEKILSQLEAIMQQHSDLRHSTEVFTAHELEAIARGDADIAAGNFVSLADFKKKYARYGI